MPDWTCKQCNKSFFRWRRGKPWVFCSPNCAQAANGGQFKPGINPWNKGTKGVMQVNSGSFKPGVDPVNKTPIGTVKIRTRHRDGQQRAWVKIAENGNPSDWLFRAVVVWQNAHGPVPHGFVVHHKDRNTLNDDLGNLEIQSRADHLKEHRHEHESRRIAALVSRRRNPITSPAVL